jgi:3-hydroxyisobutyrate dehydrogenase-like beta-hydroxyacid dehydrogenase
MYKDFELILSHAAKLSVPMPATAVAQQICAIERSKATQEDYSVIIKLMQELAGLFSS